MCVRSLSRCLLVVATVVLNGCARRVSVGPPVNVPGIAPATAPSAAHVWQAPPGFERVHVNGHAAFCEPADRSWVTQALSRAAAPQPDPAHAQTVARITAVRGALAGAIAKDLGLDGRAAGDVLDVRVLPAVRKLQDIRPPVVLLVVTRERLTTLLRNRPEWVPRWYYGSVYRPSVSVEDEIPVWTTNAMDETVLPATYAPDETPSARANALAAGVEQLDAKFTRKVAEQITPTLFTTFLDFIRDEQVEPLKLTPDQAWLGIGLAIYLAAKYTAAASNATLEQLLAVIAQEPPNFPVPARSVDLRRPLVVAGPSRDEPYRSSDEASLRKELVPYYANSMGRKATGVVALWVKAAGDDAIPKTLAALRANRPADGAGLVRLIRDRTGFDAEKYLEAEGKRD